LVKKNKKNNPIIVKKNRKSETYMVGKLERFNDKNQNEDFVIGKIK